MTDKRDTTLNISESSYLDQLKQRTKRNDSKAKVLSEARKLLIDPVEKGDEDEDE